MESINYGRHSMNAGSRNGEAVVSRGRWTCEAESRTLPKWPIRLFRRIILRTMVSTETAMYENLMDEVFFMPSDLAATSR